jgi:hypothetical protein
VSGSRRLPLTALVLAAAFLVAPAAANATNRYASPDGVAADPCSDSNDPCPIATAINGAHSGDDVTLLSGVYAPTVQLGGIGGSNVTIHGAPGARPVINFTTVTGGDGFFLTTNAVLRDVDITSNVGSNSALAVFGGSAERVSVHEAGASSRACALGKGSTIRDSVCWYTGTPGQTSGAVAAFPQFGSFTDDATLRNVTAISTGGHALVAFSVSSNNASMVVTATNVIAQGGGSGQDVHTERLTGTPNTPFSHVNLDHSNYATESEQDSGDITDPNTATNTNVTPAFVDAANGDFHQAASPTGTLDLGTATGLLPGELDIDGEPRARGTAPDIGADEIQVVPPAPTLTATSPASGANDNNPKVIGSAEPLSTVDLYPNASCAGTPAASDFAEVLASPGMPVTVPDNSSTTFSAIATNEVGSSLCSTVNVTYSEVTPPPATPPAETTPTQTPAKTKCKKGFVKKKVKGKKKCVKKKRK